MFWPLTNTNRLCYGIYIHTYIYIYIGERKEIIQRQKIQKINNTHTHARTHARKHASTHTRTHARTHTHTGTQRKNKNDINMDKDI